MITSMAKEIQMLGDTKSAMNDLVVTTREQNRKLVLLIVALSKNSGFVANPTQTRSDNKKDLLSTIIKWGSLVCILLIIAGCCMYAYGFIRDLNDVKSSDISSQYIVEPDTKIQAEVVEALSIKDTLGVTDSTVLQSTK